MRHALEAEGANYIAIGDTQAPLCRWAESALPSNVSLYGPFCKSRGAPVTNRLSGAEDPDER